MIQATVNKQKLAELNSSFNKVISNTRDFKDPLSKSANLLVEDASRNFDDQGYTYGSPWRPLKPATARQRGSYRPILYRTGTLKRGTKVKSVSKEKAIVHNPVGYAPYHQFGTRRMPQRIILDVSEKAKRAIKIIFENYVRDKITEPFRK